MALLGVPRYNKEYEALKAGLVSQRIDAVRATAKKKEWQEDRLAKVRLEDWLFTVRS